MKLSERATSITPSLTLSITAKANKLKEQGHHVIGFGAGEPDFNTPQFVCDRGKWAIDNGKTKYTPSSGLQSLREAICTKLEKDNGLSYSFKQIVVSNGAKQSLFNSLFAILNEGDEVLIPTPYWLTYPELVKLSGGVPKFLKTTKSENFKITPEKLEKAISEKTKAIILNSPSNPSGVVYSKNEIYALAKVLEDKEIFIISDEIYEKLVYGTDHVSIATYSEKIKEKTIVINGLSKSFSMTGWRVGYLAAPLEVAKAIDSCQSHMTSNPNTIAQYASLEALTKENDFLSNMVSVFKERKDLIFKGVMNIPGLSALEPQGAFYLFVDISALVGKKLNGEEITGSLKLTEMLLDEGVAVIPGLPFGEDNFIRLSYAISADDITEGLKRIEKFTQKLV